MSAAQGTTVHDRLLRLHLRHRSSAAPTVRRLPSDACAATPSVVRCSVVGPFLWPARRPGTRYQTMFEIRRVPLTVFVVTWKLFFSRSTSVHSALGVSWLCAIQIYIDIDINVNKTLHQTIYGRQAWLVPNVNTVCLFLHCRPTWWYRPLIACRPSLFMLTLSVSFVPCMLSYSIFWSQTSNKLTYLLKYTYITSHCVTQTSCYTTAISWAVQCF